MPKTYKLKLPKELQKISDITIQGKRILSVKLGLGSIWYPDIVVQKFQKGKQILGKEVDPPSKVPQAWGSIFDKLNTDSGLPVYRGPLDSTPRINKFWDMHEKAIQKFYLRENELNPRRERTPETSTIKLTSGRFRGANVPTFIIDDSVEAARKSNFPVGNLLTLMGRESTFGSTLYPWKVIDNMSLVSGWNLSEDYLPYDCMRFLADNKVPGISVHKTPLGIHYNETNAEAINKHLGGHPELLWKYRKKLEATPPLNKNMFELAIDFIKKKGVKGYNPRDPGYETMYNKDYDLLRNDPALQEYLGSKGVKFQIGGKINWLQKGKNIPEIIVYGKKDYGKALDLQKRKYNADMEKYRQDSTSWAKANKKYQDSLSLFNTSLARGNAMYNNVIKSEESWGGHSLEDIKRLREYYKKIYIDAVKNPKKYEQKILEGSMFSTIPYIPGYHVKSGAEESSGREVSIPTFIQWDSKLASDYKKDLDNKEEDINGFTNRQRYEEYSSGVELMKKQLELMKKTGIDPTHINKVEGPFQLIFKKPVYTPVQPTRPDTVPIRYIPEVHKKMRYMPNQYIGVVPPQPWMFED